MPLRGRNGRGIRERGETYVDVGADYKIKGEYNISLSWRRGGKQVFYLIEKINTVGSSIRLLGGRGEPHR